MNKSDYSKYKDSKPADTLYKIQGILHDMGLTVMHKWVDNEYDGCYSNRVSIYPTQLGTNGKGTDPAYALTSGYAELMERIQNNIINTCILSQEDDEFEGFSRFPDEKQVPIETIVRDNNSFINHVFEELGYTDELDKIYMLKGFCNICGEKNDYECSCIPFADVDNNRVVYLPHRLLFAIYGSNGMAAGNTMEEALVQSLSEIFERYAGTKIAMEHICPPTVPRSYIKTIPLLDNIISQIESDGNYKVIVKDCSLGRGLPVVAIVIINKKTGTFGVKFASHPTFSVALERTLTEAFQGRRLEQFTRISHVGLDDQIRSRDNMLNTMKMGEGAYPKELLIGTPDYEFTPFEESECKSNAEMLKRMIGFIHQEGYQLLIHDSSYLGFHTYVAIVPGMSEIYPIDQLRFRELRTYGKVYETMGHLHDLSEEEIKRIVRYMTFKRASVIENRIAWICARPFNNKFPGGDAGFMHMMACCQYALGNYAAAEAEAARVYAYYDKVGTEEEKDFYRCFRAYIHHRAIGLEADDCNQVIKELFKEDVAEKVVDALSDPKQTLAKMYPTMNCYDCEHCETNERGMCMYPHISEITRKIKTALKTNIPDQGELLENLQDYMA